MERSRPLRSNTLLRCCTDRVLPRAANHRHDRSGTDQLAPITPFIFPIGSANGCYQHALGDYADLADWSAKGERSRSQARSAGSGCWGRRLVTPLCRCSSPRSSPPMAGSPRRTAGFGRSARCSRCGAALAADAGPGWAACRVCAALPLARPTGESGPGRDLGRARVPSVMAAPDLSIIIPVFGRRTRLPGRWRRSTPAG